MANYQNWIGRQTVQHDRLTPALLQRFRATIDSAETGDIAPQAIHWVLCTPEAATAQLGQELFIQQHIIRIARHPQRGDVGREVAKNAF